PPTGHEPAYLLEMSRRRRQSDGDEMEFAAGLEGRRNPMADSAHSQGAGRHPGLRLSRRSVAASGNNSAGFADRIHNQTFRRRELARLRKNLYPGQRETPDRASGCDPKCAGKRRAFRALPARAPAELARGKDRERDLETERSGVAALGGKRGPRELSRRPIFSSA